MAFLISFRILKVKLTKLSEQKYTTKDKLISMCVCAQLQTLQKSKWQEILWQKRVSR
jgi:hypothetical protein